MAPPILIDAAWEDGRRCPAFLYAPDAPVAEATMAGTFMGRPAWFSLEEARVLFADQQFTFHAQRRSGYEQVAWP